MSRQRPNPETERLVSNKKPKKDPSDTREGLLLLARLAVEGNRYEHMLQYMKRLVGIVAPSNALSDYERHCFSNACAFLLEGQRSSYRHVAKVAADAVGVDPRRAEAAGEYLDLIKSEISKTCSDIVGVIDLCILPPDYGAAAAAASAESRAFYMKMRGDFLRYNAEVKAGTEREKLAEAAFNAFMAAKKDAVELPATDPIRLELELSLALFHAGVRGSPSTAYTVAKEAVDMGTQALKASGETASEATTLALERLQSNMDIWMI